MCVDGERATTFATLDTCHATLDTDKNTSGQKMPVASKALCCFLHSVHRCLFTCTHHIEWLVANLFTICTLCVCACVYACQPSAQITKNLIQKPATNTQTQLASGLNAIGSKCEQFVVDHTSSVLAAKSPRCISIASVQLARRLLATQLAGVSHCLNVPQDNF